MSEEAKNRLEVLVLLATLVVTLFTAVKSFALLPHRIDTIEKQLLISEAQGRLDRELLLRIDERLKNVQERLANQGK